MVPETRPLALIKSRLRTTRLPSKRPRISASSIAAEPLNKPISAISMSRQLFRLASTLPSTISLSQAVISPERVISRPTISLRTSASPRRGWEPESAGRRGASGARITSPGRDSSVARGGIIGGLTGALAPGPGGGTGFIGIPRSSAASAILRSSASVLLRLNMVGSPPSTLLKGTLHGWPGHGPRLGTRQRLEDVEHEGRGDHRRDEVDERQGEHPCDHDPAKENT